MSAVALDAVGSLCLHPGAAPAHAVLSRRPAVLQSLTQGQPAARLPALMGALFGLCGSAQRLCAQLALQATGAQLPAAPHSLPPAGVTHGGAPTAFELERTLALETAREHLRRIALDWPRQLGGGPAPVGGGAWQAAAAASLADCPWWPRRHPSHRASASHGTHEAQAALAWLETAWLGLKAHDWLAHWHTDGLDWLQRWTQQQRLWLPALLRPLCLGSAAAPDLPCVAHLPLPDQWPLAPDGAENEPRLPIWPLAADTAPAKAPATATTSATTSAPSSAPAPSWQGQLVQTGLWTRRRCRAVAAAHSTGLLGERIAELLRLSLWLAALPTVPEPAPPAALPSASGLPEPAYAPSCLAWGWRSMGALHGLAWVEMARGLLLQQVRLSDDGAPARIVEMQMWAPTDWNFAPGGVAAQALAALDPDDPQCPARVHQLMAALDPCVPYTLHPSPRQFAGPYPPLQEPCHA